MKCVPKFQLYFKTIYFICPLWFFNTVKLEGTMYISVNTYLIIDQFFLQYDMLFAVMNMCLKAVSPTGCTVGSLIADYQTNYSSSTLAVVPVV